MCQKLGCRGAVEQENGRIRFTERTTRRVSTIVAVRTTGHRSGPARFVLWSLQREFSSLLYALPPEP